MPIIEETVDTSAAASSHEELVMLSTSTFTVLRARIARRHAARADQLRLERELAAYSTPTERRELIAILERHTASEVAPIEQILSRHPVSSA